MGSPPRVGRMRRFPLLLAWAGSLSAQTPPAAVVPFLSCETDLAIVADASAVRASGLFAQRVPSPFSKWLAALADGTGLAVTEVERIALVRRPADDATKPGEAVLVLVGGTSLQLPPTTESLPSCEVAGRPARSLDAAAGSGSVLVQLESGVLVAGRRAFVELQLAASAPTEAAVAAARAAWTMEAGQLVRARFWFGGDAWNGRAQGTPSRRAGAAAAPGQLSLRWVRAEGEQFAIAFGAGPFPSEYDAVHGWITIEKLRVALAARDYAKPLHALLARAKPVQREREIAIDLSLGEASDALAAAEAVLRFAGLPLPPAR